MTAACIFRTFSLRDVGRALCATVTVRAAVEERRFSAAQAL
jgi:hypothetical protein